MPAPREVGPSAARRWWAVAAIIAALSVQRRGGGRKRPGRWRRPAPATRVAEPRVGGHAAAEHEAGGAGGVGAERQLLEQLVDHRLLERRRDVGDAERRGCARTYCTTAVLSPENDAVELPTASRAGTGSRPGRRRERAGRSPGRPGSRGRGTGRPCRTPRPPRRRRSRRARGSRPGRRRRRPSCARPTRAAPRSGVGRSGCSSQPAYRWPSRWFTPTYGTPRHERERLRRAHAHEQRAGESRPVARGDRVDVARARRPPPRARRPPRAPRGRRARGWRPRAPRRRTARAGRPGSTPPTSGSTRPSSTTAAAVSSHDVSIPRISIGSGRSVIASGARTRCSPGHTRLEPGKQPRVLGRVDVVDPHHQRVLVGLLVVVLAHAHRREPEAAVQLLRALVRHAHLEGEVVGAAHERLARERDHEPRRDAAPVPGRDRRRSW